MGLDPRHISELERDSEAVKQIIGRLRRNAAICLRVMQGDVSAEKGKRAGYELVEDSFTLAKLFAIPESQIDDSLPQL